MLRQHDLLDENSEPTSIGSMLHEKDMCKVCVFAFAGNCTNGVFCEFCHLPHRRALRKTAMRPCKGKRDRYRKLVSRLEGEIQCDPDSFDVDKLELPPSIAADECARAKLLAKLQVRLGQAKAERQAQLRCEPGPSSEQQGSGAKKQLLTL